MVLPLVIPIPPTGSPESVWDAAFAAAFTAGYPRQECRTHADHAVADAVFERQHHHREAPSDPDTFNLESA